jgi:hypothetical protein
VRVDARVDPAPRGWGRAGSGRPEPGFPEVWGGLTVLLRANPPHTRLAGVHDAGRVAAG